MNNRQRVCVNPITKKSVAGLGDPLAGPLLDGVKRLKLEPIRVHDPQPEFTVTRRWFRGDRHLAVVDVDIQEPAA